MNILNIESLNKSFGGIVATSNLTIGVTREEMLGILGPNGAGKTTLFNEITGFIYPDSGKIIYNGSDISGMQPYKIANMGIVRTFQLVRPFKNCTVKENIIIPSASPRMKHKLNSRGAINRWVEQIAEFCELKELLNERVEHLPYGILRKLEMAKAMAMSPEILLLDEPFSGLSEHEVKPLSKIVKKINNSGTTIILVEHKLREFMKLVTRIVVIDHGEKIAEGEPEAVMNNPKVIRAYIGGQADENS